MRRAWLLVLAGCAPLSGTARSEVVAVNDIGFLASNSADIAADADSVYALLVQPARWWSSRHTYSGDAANMRIDPRAGGCFCEVLPGRDGRPDGSVEHARVIYAAPGRQLRLSGALGPLQSEAVTGTLDFAITSAGQGKGVRVTLSYTAGGYLRGGPRAIAPSVDQVLAEQLAGLKRAAEAPAP